MPSNTNLDEQPQHFAAARMRPLTSRIRAVDALRGVVMALMALDHLRDFLGNAHYDATDLAQTTVPVFVSRWITHFCAPTFFLLAGVSAYLSIRTGRRSVGEAARYLAVRGLALVMVEQTLLRCFGWYFHFDYHFMNAGVLFGLGLSMLLLAAFVRLPPWVSLVVGLAIIVGEGPIARLEMGNHTLDTLIALLTRSRDFEPWPGYHFFVSYPPIPWFGAMAFGYGFAAVVYGKQEVRRQALVLVGTLFIVAFMICRWFQIGDPATWTSRFGGFWTLLSFINVSKYPPSFTFLLLTLGIALLGVAAFERWPWRVAEIYGRVPLFFYVIHVPLIHGVAVVYSFLTFGAATWLTSGPVIFWDIPLPGSPPGYGFGLFWVWVIWAVLIVALYPLCRWYWGARGNKFQPAVT
jgi:uncharacterized membrane protein